MYFKIENKESELYKKVMAYIEKRRKQRKENFKYIEEYLGVKYTKSLYTGPDFNCLPRVIGIVPIDVTEIEGMKPDKEHPDVLVPNLRTKRGKEINTFIRKLPNWSYDTELNFFPVKEKNIYGERFFFPYVEEFNGIILVRLDDKHKPIPNDVFVEVTQTEFKKIGKFKEL